MAELKRTLGFWAIVALSISSIIGTGMFFGASVGADEGGNTSLIAWFVLSIISVYVAACFGELVGMFPSAGGIYEYCKQTYGRFYSFIIGWTTFLVYNITTTLLVVAAVNSLAPAHFPFMNKVILTIFFILALNLIVFTGIEASSFAAVIFAVITIALMTAIIIPGFLKMNAPNFYPIMTHPPIYILLVLFFIFEAFFGWESATYLAEETKDAQTVIPSALIFSTIIVTILTMLIVIVSLGIIPWYTIAKSASPTTDVATAIYGETGRWVAGLGVYLVLIGSALGGIIATPRLLFAMARDRLFLNQFTLIHKKYKTPYKAILFQTVVSLFVIILAFGSYKAILSLLIPFSVFIYISALIALVILRYKKPEIHRPFKVPFGTVVPIIVSLIFLAVLATWVYIEGGYALILLSISLIALGIPMYFLMQMYHNPKMIVKINDLLARFSLMTEKYSLPQKVKDNISKLLGSIKGKTVFEFGCNVGSLTLHLAEKAGRKGRIYATNDSSREVEITVERIRQKGFRHVDVLKEEDADSIHPKIRNADAAVSVGILGYIQNVENTLREANRRMKKGARICFLDYDKYFGIIPNVPWLRNNDKIKNVFKKSGFDVNVARKSALLWQYVYVYGKKTKNIK